MLRATGFPAGKGITATDIGNIPGNPSLINSFLGENSNGGNAKAFLCWALFDERLKFVDGDVDPVGGGGKEVHDKFLNDPVVASQSGYLYIYVSNESNLSVFFDNLSITHLPGSILEENAYYPFGLTMNGISSNALNNQPEYKYKFNGIEQTIELGLNQYDAFYRNYDPQIGRWFQIDPKSRDWESPYVAMGNNPVLYADFLGDTLTPQQAKILLVQPRSKDGDQSGFIKNATAKEYSDNPVMAAGKDISHAVFEFFGVNAVDDFVQDRRDGKNSAGEIIEGALYVGLSTVKGEKVKGGKAEIVIDANVNPEAAKHAQDALNNGVSGEGVIDRAGAKNRRAENLRGVETKKGKDRDEFPPAVINNGGNGSSVRHIDPSDNRSAGAYIGNQIRNLPDNTRVVIRVLPEVKKK